MSYGFIMFLIIVVFFLSLIASGKVERTFRKYDTLPGARGSTGRDLAEDVLFDNGLSVAVQPVNGSLTDHYDPKNQTVGLSTVVYGNTSVSALAVAAHELGHVLQHAEGYGPLNLRNTLLPVARLGSAAGPYIILLGLFINSTPIAKAGLILYGLMFAFQVVTLPVEFNASDRGLELLEHGGYVAASDMPCARKVLRAAAMTYVLSALASFLSLLRFAALINGRRRD